MGAPLIYAVAGLGQLGLGAYNAWQQSQRSREAKGELDKRLQDWRSQDTSNLYANMQNTMEDLAVNQQQAQFTAQQQAQGFANTMQSLRGVAGGSGIAALAQSLAGQQSLAAQQASASIGAQEARNQQLAAGQASRLQIYERQGAEQSRALQASMSETELVMAMQEQAAANKARQEAIAAAVGGAVNLGAGLAMGAVGDFKKQFNIGAGGDTGAVAGAGAAMKSAGDYQTDYTGQGLTEHELYPGKTLHRGYTSIETTQEDFIDVLRHGNPSSGQPFDARELGLDLSYLGIAPFANGEMTYTGNVPANGLKYLPYPNSTGNLPVMYQNPIK